MIKVETLLKNKNKILNFGIIFLLLFIALQIYKYGNQQMNSLAEQKENELKKNKVIENIVVLEKQIGAYSKVFVKKDLGSVMDTMSSIAKANTIKIISIRPISEQAYADYIKSSFLITAQAPNYHSLGDFISQVENYKDIYLVDEVIIASSGSGYVAGSGNTGLNVSLKISTISYLNDQPGK